MKKMTFLAMALCMSGAAWSQTMKIHTGNVTVAVPVAQAGEMVYGAGGTTFSVMGKTYNICDIDSITVDRSVVAPYAVAVNYDGGRAHVVVPGKIAPRLTVDVKGADVSVVAALELQEEVFYTLQGKSDNGSFFMDGEFKSTVTLDNLTLSNNRGAAIDIANGKRIDVIVPTGTQTVLSDGAGMQKACFFVNGHPEFSGGGTLLLTGNAKHAFASDEYTRFKKSFGTLKVLKAVGDGLHIEQYLLMNGGNLDISKTGGDCIDVSVTKTPADSLNGQVHIKGGSVRMVVNADDTKGIKCDSDMVITGGTIEAGVAGSGAKGLSVGKNWLVQEFPGVPTKIKMYVTGGTYMPGDLLLEAKCRGVKAKGNFTFDGGEIQISADVSGKKNKSISIDGEFIYKKGVRNCTVYTPLGDF